MADHKSLLLFKVIRRGNGAVTNYIPRLNSHLVNIINIYTSRIINGFVNRDGLTIILGRVRLFKFYPVPTETPKDKDQDTLHQDEEEKRGCAWYVELSFTFFTPLVADVQLVKDVVDKYTDKVGSKCDDMNDHHFLVK